MTFKKQKIKLIDEKTEKAFIVNGYRMKLELYEVYIDVIIGNRSEVKRFWKQSMVCGGFVYSNEDTHFLWIRNKDASILAHEVYHLVNRISKARGLSEDEDNEQQAYLVGWLYKEISKLKSY